MTGTRLRVCRKPLEVSSPKIIFVENRGDTLADVTRLAEDDDTGVYQ